MAQHVAEEQPCLDVVRIGLHRRRQPFDRLSGPPGGSHHDAQAVMCAREVWSELQRGFELLLPGPGVAGEKQCRPQPMVKRRGIRRHARAPAGSSSSPSRSRRPRAPRSRAIRRPRRSSASRARRCMSGSANADIRLTATLQVRLSLCEIAETAIRQTQRVVDGRRTADSAPAPLPGTSPHRRSPAWPAPRDRGRREARPPPAGASAPSRSVGSAASGRSCARYPSAQPHQRRNVLRSQPDRLFERRNRLIGRTLRLVQMAEIGTASACRPAPASAH